MTPCGGFHQFSRNLHQAFESRQSADCKVMEQLSSHQAKEVLDVPLRDRPQELQVSQLFCSFALTFSYSSEVVPCFL